MASDSGLRSALGFLTVVGGATSLSARSVAWFGPVGAGVGATVGLAWWAFGRVMPPLVSAVLALMVDGALTGLLHTDGLADAADGLLPPLPRERRLAVMRAPDVGAFGVAVVVAVFALRVAALTSLTPRVCLVAALWAASRSLMAGALGFQRYARVAEGGLASAFQNRRACTVALLVGVPLSVTLAAMAGVAGLVALVSAVGAGVGVLAFAQRRVGGYTGDVLGAAGIIAETVGLVVATVRV